jgi:ABC-2 type transport system ATP-binding protein
MIDQGNILQLNNINLEFGGALVLNNINFNIKKGSIFGLIGGSGAGKTTLMRTMIGFYKPTSGKIIVDGDESLTQTDLRKIFGFCTQENSFYTELSLIENMRYFGRLQDINKKELETRIEELLKMVDLWNFKDYKSENISGGMKRRFDLAISLIHNPRLVILDEPTTGLDSILRKKIWMIIKLIQSKGVTVIISSHLLDEIDYLCDTICILKKGSVYGVGTPKQLKQLYSQNHQVSIESVPGNYRIIKEILDKKKIDISNLQVDNGVFIFQTKTSEMFLKIIKETLNEANEKFISVKLEQPDLSKILQSIIIEK